MGRTQLRKRQKHNNISANDRFSMTPSHHQYQTSCEPTNGDTSSSKKLESSYLKLFLAGSYAILHVLGLILFLRGFVFRSDFHNGKECDMTYSFREFLEIKTNYIPTSEAALDYKLYKFTDRRDPRFRPLLQAQQPLGENSNWCNGNSNIHPKNIVLYIPGHWGSYTQSRSLGAHGIQLTGTGSSEAKHFQRMQKALANNLWTGNSTSIKTFVYDVYSVDFAGQGGALHGEFLRLQSEFVACAVMKLAEMCNVSSVTIVGHSMGGLVARLTPINHPETKYLIRNIITLATPHTNPIYSFDSSIQEIYQRIKENKNRDTLIVSISGGPRDEMIEPSAGDVKTTSSFSIQAFKLLQRGEYGMDHQAIAWCHGVLEEVRRVIWKLSSTETPNIDILERLYQVKTVLGSDEPSLKYAETYQNDLRLALSKLANTNTIKVWCMEVAMLYNLPYLLGFYSLLAGLKCAFFDYSYKSDPIFLITGVTFAFHLGIEMSLKSIFVSFFVANWVYHALWLLIASQLGWMAGRLPERMTIKKCCISLACTLSFGFWFVMLILFGLVKNRMQGYAFISYLYTISMLYLCVAVMIGIDDSKCGNRNLKVSFACLVLVVTPVTLTGPLSLLSWEGVTRLKSWLVLIQLLVAVSVLCLTQIYFYNSSKPKASRARSVLVSASVLKVVGYALCERGNIFWLKDLIPMVAWTSAGMDALQFWIDESSRTESS